MLELEIAKNGKNITLWNIETGGRALRAGE
jgi:hypothetical protein